MNRRFIRLSFALLLGLSMLMFSMITRAEPEIPTQAAAMALMECETGSFIAEQNADERLPMASTTKIMTALIVIEGCDLNELVCVPKEAVGTEGSSIYLTEGEEISVRDLLFGLMLSSGNDAAIALACHVSGSSAVFVEKMNSRAKELGLTDTHFVTPNGLHDSEHYTTARELCFLTAEAVKNPIFREIVSTKYHTAESGSKTRTFKNKNSLLWTCDGAFGVKTGYTMYAGRCLVFGAERDGLTVIGTLLNCRPMFEVAGKLLDYAFENYSKETAIKESQIILKTQIENSSELLEVLAKESIIVLMRRDDEMSLRTSVCMKESITAPVSAGEAVGMLYLYEGDELVGQTELIAGRDVKGRGYDYWLSLMIRLFASKL